MLLRLWQLDRCREADGDEERGWLGVYTLGLWSEIACCCHDGEIAVLIGLFVEVG